MNIINFDHREFTRSSLISDTLIKLLISVSDLNEEQEEEVYNILETQVKSFVKSRDYSSNKRKGVSALTDFIHKAYDVSLVAVNMGSLEILVECRTLQSLEHLWNDYLSGHLSKVAERYLVTDEMKKKLGLETINLKTTINEEDYLACRKFFAKMTGEADIDLLSSQQGFLDQGSSTSEMNTSADYTAVKEQETTCAMRMKKAKVSRSALHRAAVNGQYEEVKRHLKNGANVDERDQFLLTPLHLACWYGHECVVKLLLDHNADVNAVDRFQFTPLQKAERHNHQSIIQLLLDHGAKPSLQQPLSLRTFAKRAFLRTDSHSGFNLLQAAVLQGDYDSVYKASNCLENFVDEMKCETISNNASIFHGKSAVDVLSSMNWRKTGHVAIEILYQRLVKIDERLKELHLCVKRGDVEKVIELVLNDGVDVNVAAMSNITPLLLASRMSCSVLIKTLIDLGADVNAQTAPAKEGPLVFAASGNNYMVARVLLEHGADANIRDRWGETPLHKAVTEKDVPLVKLLLEMKADANIQDQSGETPLHKAVRPKGLLRFVEFLGNMADPNIQDRLKQTYLRDRNLLYEADVPLVKLLLKNKANANIQNQSGTTPLHLCAFYGRYHISQLLIESGCNINRRNNKGETPRDIETPERQWSKTPSAGYSQQVESLTLVERSRPAWQEVTDLKPESRGKIKAEDLLLPQTARPPHSSEQNLKERVRKARKKRLIKGVVKKKRQQLASGEEESQAQVTRQPEVTKEAKAEGQASG